MLTSFALIFLIGLIMGKIFEKIGLPSLLGMIITGMILSPYALDLLDPKILDISADLRQIALVIILTRAGFSLNIDDLRRVGRPAVLMCFVPATLEILAVVLVAPKILGLTYIEAAIMGTVIAAVSPAVIVPRMIKLIDGEYGKENSVPQLILAGASVDDIFVIVLFSVFTSLALGGSISALNFVEIPVSIILGILLGIFVGFLLVEFFNRFEIGDTKKILIILSISFLLLQLESFLEGIVPVSALLSIMTLGIVMGRKNLKLAIKLSEKYNKLWIAAEILLFVLVGATVDLNYAIEAGFSSIIIVLIALVFRMFGVFISLLKTRLNKKERLFCMIAYTPKATVQAAIGAIPLSMGLASGHDILTVAVLSILITAPFGAIGIDKLYNKLLVKGE